MDGAEVPDRAPHPIELFAKTYGFQAFVRRPRHVRHEC